MKNNKRVSGKKVQQHFNAALKKIELVKAKQQEGGLDGHYKRMRSKRIMRKASIMFAVISVIVLFIVTPLLRGYLWNDMNFMGPFLATIAVGIGSMFIAVVMFEVTLEPNPALIDVKTVVRGIRHATEMDARRELYPDEISLWPNMEIDPLDATSLYLRRRTHEIDVEIKRIENEDVDALDKRALLKKVLSAIAAAQRVIEQTQTKPVKL